MRINLTSIFILTGFFVACGGTGDNFADGGDEGGFGGGQDAPQTGDEAVPSSDGQSPFGDTGPLKDVSTDTTTGSCSSTCTSDAFCASACGTTSTYCCDIATGACYPTSLAMCPASTTDGGGDAMMY
jgi:hypothetical protein